ncbi:MAG: MAPEG family protein [Gammaproteobacteria bacterium]|nr:MAG: MAPEG family protein [Gammaproteobacteria bacterium]
MTTLLPFSMFYLSLISALALFLTMRVVKVRMDTSIGLSHGGDENLTRQIRVHANLLENLLPFALLFILAELNQTSIIFLHLAGAFFLLARLLHAYGFSKKSGRSSGRYYGTIISWLVIATLIGLNFYYGLTFLIS